MCCIYSKSTYNLYIVQSVRSMSTTLNNILKIFNIYLHKNQKKRVLRFNFSGIFIINIIIHILIVRYRQWSLHNPVRPQPDPTALTIPAHCASFASCGRRQSVSIECVCRYRSHCRISASLICVIPWTADPCEIGATNTQHRKRDFWVFQIFGNAFKCEKQQQQLEQLEIANGKLRKTARRWGWERVQGREEGRERGRGY